MRSLILDATVRFIFDGAVVLSIYLLFAGHNQPGGGFVGGLIAAAAIALRHIAGDDEMHSSLRFPPWTYMAAGLAIATGMATAPLLFGDAPLEQFVFEWHPPVLGDVVLATATVFDTGVYLIVVGLVLMIFEGLGDEPASPVSPVSPDDPDRPDSDVPEGAGSSAGEDRS